MEGFSYNKLDDESSTEQSSTRPVLVRKRARMNFFGPLLVALSILLNFWTVMVYFVFPYTNFIIVNY